MTFLTRFDRWDPFEELSSLRGRMDQLWSKLSDEKELQAREWAPVSDVVERDKEILIRAELPGVDEKNINVQIENGILTIRGERQVEAESNDGGFRKIERSHGTFFRSFIVPPTVAPEKVTASFENGLLQVSLPKTEQPRSKAIKVAIQKQLTPVSV